MTRRCRFFVPAALLGAWLVSTAAHGAPPPASGDESLDRTTPRRAFVGLDASCSSGDFGRASKYLDLRAVPQTLQEGAEVARQLCHVLARKTAIDVATLPDTADAGGNRVTVTLATIDVDEEPITIDLARVRFADGVSRWIVSRGTVAAVPELNAAFGARGVEERIPSFLREPHVLAVAPWQWMGLLLFVGVSIVFARLLTWIVMIIATRIATRTKNQFDDHIVKYARSPLRLLLAVAAFRLTSPLLVLAFDAWEVIVRLLSALTIIGVAWLATRTMRGGADWLEEQTSAGSREYDSRGLRTRVTVLYRVATLAVFVVAVAAALLQFDVARQVGTSLLASAGIAGVVIGLAAQKSLGAVIGGLQISIAQPIRIGDTVVVDAQQGVVEEIHLTYAVLRLPDDRRLITPIGRFLEQSFENWTKLGSELRGYVTIPADFDTPVEEVRKELAALCKKSPHADGRYCRLEVLDVTADKALTLRATVSAKDADALWELRCTIRESLVMFLATLDQGKHLPRGRAQAVS